MHQARVLAAAVGWMLSITLMVVATVVQELELCAWSLLVAVGAFVPTAWAIIEHAFARAILSERARTEELIEAVACRFAESEVPNLGTRRRQ